MAQRNDEKSIGFGGLGSVAGGDVDLAVKGVAGAPAAQVVGEELDGAVDGAGRAPRDVGTEPHPRVVVQPVTGRKRLRVDDVERRPGHVALIEGGAQSVLVDEGAA